MAESNDLKALNDRLDALWIRYLSLLDEYTTAQAAIKKHMAAGFFSLTQANFKSSGRRYGQDHYDGRAIATTRVRLESRDDAVTLDVISVQPEENDSKAEAEGEQHDTDAEKVNVLVSGKLDAQQLPSPSPTPEPGAKEEQAHQHSKVDTDHMNNENASKTERPKANTHDPIRWFGILVPPSLRQAQKSFSQAVQTEACITQAVNAARGLRDTEAEIRKLRKALKKAERDASATKAARE